MKYKFLIFVISFCLSSLLIQSQNINTENIELYEDIEGVFEIVNQLQSSIDQSITLTAQIGDLNTIEILSDPQGEANTNIVAITQYGNQNTGILNQFGNGQEIGIFQKGNQNIADILAKGINIYQTVTQIGSNNYVNHDIDNGTNTSIKNITSEQIGDENKIILQSGIVDYSIIEIIQHGNNNNAELDFTNASIQTEPYQITQTGNFGDIVITKSDFYMPMKAK